MRDYWNTSAIHRLIERKARAGKRPAYLFIGQQEAKLLRRHLGCAFGPGSVQSLKHLYYMGMEVVELQIDSYLRTACSQRVEGLMEALNRRPGWRELEASSFWVDALR